MWSIGGAVLVEVAVCIGAIAFALQRVHRELEPTSRSFGRLHGDVRSAVDLISRDAGRVTAGRRLLREDR